MASTTFESRAGPSGYNPPRLDVSVRSDGPFDWVVEVRGELDLFTGPMLHARLESYRAANGSDAHRRTIVYVLSDLDFIDARGLHYLLSAVDGHGLEAITVREPSRRVRRLLELVGMDAMIEKPVSR